MNFRVKHYFALFAIVVLTIPLWARTLKGSIRISKNETIGSAELKPGLYDFVADGSNTELNVLQNGKVIATAKGQWIKIPKKATGLTTQVEGDKITLVQFDGSDQAFQPQ